MAFWFESSSGAWFGLSYPCHREAFINPVAAGLPPPPTTGKSPSNTMHLPRPPAPLRHGRRDRFRRTVHEPSPPRPVRSILPWKVFFRSSGSQIMNGGKVLRDGVAGFRKTPVTAAGIRLMCMAADCDRSLGIGVTCRSCILSTTYFQCGCDRCLSRRFESPAAWSDSVGPSWDSGLTKKLCVRHEAQNH